MFAFSGSLAESQRRQEDNHIRQMEEKAEYEKRVRELGASSLLSLNHPAD
jgi:hypothetical protein